MREHRKNLRVKEKGDRMPVASLAADPPQLHSLVDGCPFPLPVER